MAKVELMGGENEYAGDVYYMFDCPGCGLSHMPRTGGQPGRPLWTFNGDVERPTFEPSILVRRTYGADKTQQVCHSFVRDGKIQFLGDCTHELAGQTVDLPEVEI